MPKIALIQLSADARPSVNKEKTEAAIREAAANGAQIVCTQELFTTEYFCRTEECDLFNLAEPVPGELTEAHRKLAEELGVVIVASGFEKRATGLYHNTAWVTVFMFRASGYSVFMVCSRLFDWLQVLS